MTPRKLSTEINWFLVVGLCATAVHAGVGLSAERLGMAPLWANTLAFVCALGISYGGNSVLTFRTPVRRAGAFARFAGLSLVGFGLNQAIVGLAVYRLGLPYWVGLGAALAVVPPLTFVAARGWALRAGAARTQTTEI